jgi:hypothetical protein
MWQPLCNGIGMGAGGFVGNALFLTFESEEFSNDYIILCSESRKRPAELLT